MLIAPSPFLLGRTRQWINVFRARDVDGYVGKTSFIRTLVKPSNGFPLDGARLRATFMSGPPASASFAVSIVTMGIWDGVAGKANMLSTPVEVKFGGGSGFSDIGGGATIQSDPINITFGQTDGLVFHIECLLANLTGALFNAPSCHSYSVASSNANKAVITTAFTLLDLDLVGIYAVDVFR